MNNILIVAIFIIFYSPTLRAQKYTNIPLDHKGKLRTISILKIGDTLPDIIIANVINNKNTSINTSEFKNQLLIIDFWSIGCKGCVMALPMMDSLQRNYGKRIKILPVTYEDEKLVVNFWKNNHYTKGVSLPSVVGDSILSSYFRHKTIPHEVWIYKGKVIGITTSQYVDSFHIDQVLGGNKINWPVKDDFYSFNSDTPLFVIDTNQVNQENTFLEYAALSDYREGVNSESLSGGGGIIRNLNTKTIRFFFLNQPVYTSYASICLQADRKDPLIKPSLILEPNQIVWDVKNINKYKYISQETSGYEQEWVRKHAFCFESIHPDTGQSDRVVYKQAMKDLNQLLGLNVHWERRNENVFLLEKDSTIKNIKILNVGARASTLVYLLNQNANFPYVFSDSASKKIFIANTLKNINNIKVLQDSLLLYGLRLSIKKKDVDKLVFSEKADFLSDQNLIDQYDLIKKKSISLSNPSDVENLQFLKKNKNKSGVIELPSGLQYKIIVQGKGPMIKKEEKIKVNYTGMLVNGKIFESSLSTGLPITLKLSEMILGWQEAIKIMPVGSKWILYIPASLAYASSTYQGIIPQNSTLIFEIELLQLI